MAPPNREGGGGLSLRTLVIASAASLTAAMATSRLFPPGTIYASALTPVIVAAVSEMLSRPVDRVSALREERRTLVMETRRAETARVLGEEASPLRGAPELALGDEAGDLVPQNGGVTPRQAGDIRRAVGRPRRRIHPKVWVATGLVAFAIAVAALTLPELIFGGAVSTNHRTTFFGGPTHQTTQPKQSTTTGQTTTQTTHTTTTQSQTTTQPAPTTTTGTGTSDTSTAPGGGTPAPTGSTTTPAPPPTTTGG
ncbi:MAG: hypothetical protein ACJ76Z_01500 [Thermoleophilaceae bacterium]